MDIKLRFISKSVYYLWRVKMNVLNKVIEWILRSFFILCFINDILDYV